MSFVLITRLTKKKNNEGCEVRTRADNCPADLKSAALDHSANPPLSAVEFQNCFHD